MAFRKNPSVARMLARLLDLFEAETVSVTMTKGGVYTVDVRVKRPGASRRVGIALSLSGAVTRAYEAAVSARALAIAEAAAS